MNYELAIQLKDAGFPQGDSVYPKDISGQICPKIPTLTELIEACGEHIDTIRLNHKTLDWEAGEWDWYNGGWGHYGSGKTPEEAVARLWLELNKKHDK